VKVLGAMRFNFSPLALRGDDRAGVIRLTHWLLGKRGEGAAKIACVLFLILCIDAHARSPDGVNVAPSGITDAEKSIQLKDAGDTHSKAVRAIEILRDECVSCHRSGKSKGGLILTAEDRLRAGGESGPVVVAGKPEESLLLSVLSVDGDPHMPPKKQLKSADLEVIREWIAAGVPWDASIMHRPPRVAPVVLSPTTAAVEPVLAVSFSPDGTRLALARGGKIEIRDATQPKYPVQLTFGAHTDAVISLAWSVDGATLVSGGFRRVAFWDAATGVAAWEWTEGAVGSVTAVAFAPSGERLWVADSLASRGGFMHELDLQIKSRAGTWKAHDDSVFAVAVSVDGQWIATAGADRAAKRWNASTKVLEATYEGHTNHVLAVTFDPLTPRLATAGADREVKVWDRDSREQDAVLGDRRQVFPCLFWTKDGSKLVGVTDKGNGSMFSAIQKHSGAQTTETSKVQKLDKVEGSLQCVSAKPDGSEVAAGSSEGRLFVWNGSTGKLIETE
jgi:WD40 repeat protein